MLEATPYAEPTGMFGSMPPCHRAKFSFTSRVFTAQRTLIRGLCLHRPVAIQHYDLPKCRLMAFFCETSIDKFGLFTDLKGGFRVVATIIRVKSVGTQTTAKDVGEDNLQITRICRNTA